MPYIFKRRILRFMLTVFWDDSKVLQEAINAVEEKYGFGIVFIPPGRYGIKESVYLWKGIRLIGYGSERPVFVLPQQSAEFSSDTVK